MLHLGSKDRIREFKGEYQGQSKSQSFEEHEIRYMDENKKILNLHEQKFVKLAIFQENTTIFQANTNASFKNLEI